MHLIAIDDHLIDRLFQSLVALSQPEYLFYLEYDLHLDALCSLPVCLHSFSLLEEW